MKGSPVTKDPNLQYWRIYLSFLKEKAGLPTIPSLLYQTIQKVNNITLKSCILTYNAEGYVCIMISNTINYYQLRFLSTYSF